MGETAVTDAPILLRDDQNGVATLTLNRPQARNSLSREMLGTLHRALDDIAADETIRAVVLAANGPAFCAGHDLKELCAADYGRDFTQALFSECSALMQAIVRLPKPVIAAVEGIATAAGCQLVASCDLALAAENARFATPGVNIGLFCSTPMVALSRNVAPKHAMQMLLTGDMIDAATALRFGLINDVAPTGEVLSRAQEWATKIAAKSPLTLAIGKEAFYRQAEMPLEQAYAYASQVMVDNLQALDAREGIDAFINKRAPVWCGK